MENDKLLKSLEDLYKDLIWLDVELESELNNGLNLKDKGQIVVICRSGARSGSVVNHFVNQLNLDATNLQGGVIAWNRIDGEFEQV